MAYKGRFIPKNPKKYKGDPTKIIYRSLWEYRVMEYFDSTAAVLEWCSEEVVVWYFDPTTQRKRRYFPDFVILAQQPKGVTKTIMIEVKPRAQTIEPSPKRKKTKQYIYEVTTWGTNQAKWDSARAYCQDHGWEFQILTEHEIFGR